MRLFGVLEAGRTKMVCVITDTGGDILERVVIPTRTPAETMPDVVNFFDGKGLAAIGVGCFGPVCLDRLSPAFGTILTTAKLEWQGFPMVRYIEDALDVPVGFDTNVNAAVLGEYTWGSLQDIGNSIYITIGTGIGVGVLVGGKPLHGMVHPEGGHIPVTRHPDDPLEKGVCAYHPYCLEGFASGPAIAARWGSPAEELGDRKEVWELEAYYLGQAIRTYIMTLSPERIVLGGGVAHQEALYPLLRAEVKKQVNGYIQSPLLDDMGGYIIPSRLENLEGIFGGLQLAVDAFLAHGGRL